MVLLMQYFRSKFKTSFRKTYLEVIAVFLQQGFNQE